jgi:hypothetical protein
LSNKKKIRLYLSGGLGNQLFQYATAIIFANKENRQLIVDISFYKYKINKSVERNVELFDFDILKHPTVTNYLLFKLISSISSRQLRVLGKFFGVPIFKTPFSFLELPKNINFLYGYFQNSCFFKNHQHELYKMFQSITHSSDNCKLLTIELKEIDNTVCIHIRRGDYLQATANSGYYPLNKSYFTNSINKLQSIQENLYFYIFSDDIDWCIIEFSWLKNVKFISPNDFSTSETLLLMSLCRHFIISNSTFSWWAAFLGQKNKGTIIMPSMWQVNLQTNNSGLVIENAILI